MENDIEEILRCSIDMLCDDEEWSIIQTYVFAVHKETGKTLSQIREEFMEHEKEKASID